jgi:hypothetical protein
MTGYLNAFDLECIHENVEKGRPRIHGFSRGRRAWRIHGDRPHASGARCRRRGLESRPRHPEDAIRCYIEGLKKAKEPILVERETGKFKISVVA